MRKLIMGAAAALAMLGAASAQAAEARLIVGVDTPGDVQLEKTQYFFGGQNYCFYDGGWHGPGFYYCGYAWRRGYGWGGPAGWRGWASGPHYWHGGAWVGPRNYSHPEWRGGGQGHAGGGRGGDGHAGGHEHR